MADINSLFDKFPDYDVFTGKTERKHPKASDAPKPRVQAPDIPAQNIDSRSASDYGDGFGKAIKPVQIKRNKNNNFLSLFYFPILIIWLEFTLRLSCGIGFNPMSALYIIVFSIAAASAFTLICTFAGNFFNRLMCNLITLGLTFFYIFEMVYYSAFKTFFSASQTYSLNPEQFIYYIDKQKFFAIAAAVPLIINFLFGHRIFGFRKLKIPAKIIVIIIAVIISAAALSAVNNVDAAAKSIYNSSSNQNIQERFGLLTMEILDILR